MRDPLRVVANLGEALLGESVLVVRRPTPARAGIVDRAGHAIGEIVRREPPRPRGERKYVWEVMDGDGRTVLSIEGGPDRRWTVHNADGRLVATVEPHGHERRVLDPDGCPMATMRGGRLWSDRGTEIACVTSRPRARVVAFAPDADSTQRRVALALGAVRLPDTRGMVGIVGSPWRPLADRTTRIAGTGLLVGIAILVVGIVVVGSRRGTDAASHIVGGSSAHAAASEPTLPPVPPCQSGCEAARRLLVPIPGFEYRNFLPALNGGVSGLSVTLKGGDLSQHGLPTNGAFLYIDQPQVHLPSCDVADTTVTGNRPFAGVTLFTGITKENDLYFCFALEPFRVIIFGEPASTIEDFIAQFVAANRPS
jgi:hypothetical protein